jgi:hypothetical protein
MCSVVFFNVPSKTALTSGGPMQLPILYRETRNLNAFFVIEQALVQAALDEIGATEVHPTCEWGSRSLIDRMIETRFAGGRKFTSNIKTVMRLTGPAGMSSLAAGRESPNQF